MGIGAFAEKPLVAAGQCTKADPAASPAKLRGYGVMAGKTIAVDIDGRKLATAASLGATNTVNARDTDPVTAVRELAGGFGADVVALLPPADRPVSPGAPGPRRVREWIDRGYGEEADNARHRKVRARVEHTFARTKNYKILRDCRRRCNGLHAVARMHHLALAA